MKMKFKTASDLRQAKNIGAAIEKCLNEIGVLTLADLEKMTSVEAFKKYVITIPARRYLYAITCIPWKGRC